MSQSRVPQILGVAISFTVTAVILAGLRLYTRIHLTKAYGWDDTLLIVSMCAFITSIGFLFKGCQAGLGKPQKDITLQELIDGMMYTQLSYGTYLCVVGFVRASIAVALLRLVTARRYIYSIWASMVLNLGTLVAGLVYNFLTCTPTSYIWNRYKPGTKGTCLPPTTLVYLSYGTSAAGILLDFIFVLIPCLVIWNLQLTRRVKITAMSTMSLGVFATIAIIIRLQYLIDFTDNTDHLYSLSDIAIWCIIEAGLALSGACVMTLRPLVRRHGIFVSGYSSSARGQTSESAGQGKLIKIPDWPSERKPRVDTTSQRVGNNHESDEEIFDISAIVMTRDFEVSESKKALSSKSLC
ncbi:hypothetical protein BKA65DRAFT_570442 [Rhexocercosporidium sp. MPI-PUGE-AT-0058]|nr:hypothetical protein BKA65DRAFT_570442 [Rhexocercosporidium sp. MPI-PUGE-AT-0058]